MKITNVEWKIRRPLGQGVLDPLQSNGKGLIISYYWSVFSTAREAALGAPPDKVHARGSPGERRDAQNL